MKTTTTANVAIRAVKDGASVVDDTRAFKLLNEIRQWVYSQQRQLGIDLSKTLCMQVQCFCTDCSKCSTEYRGFRLPGDTLSLEAVSVNNKHVNVHSHWRLPYDGIEGSPCDPSLRLIDGGYKPTERDIICGTNTQLRVVAEGKGCESQVMVISGVTIEDRIEQVQVDVTGQDQTITNKFFKTITDVRFPNGATSIVSLKESSGRELARYMPGEHVARFREYKIVGNNCACIENITVIANCAYVEVYDMCDIVEFGNTLVWKWLSKYLVSMNKSDKNGNDRANLALWLQSATDLMVQEAAVEEGESVDFSFQRKALSTRSQLSAHKNHW